MSIRFHIQFLAWSSDAKAVALYENLIGPEGGGSGSLVLAELMTGKTTRFTFTSDFSPGGSTHPQTIAVNACEEALRQAHAELERLKITAVRLDDEGCKSPTRRGQLSSEQRAAPLVWAPTADKPELALTNAKLVWKAGKVTARSGASRVAVMEVTTPYFELQRAPDDAALFVASDGNGVLPVVVYRAKDALKVFTLRYSAKHAT